jgi:cytochrome oxidase assembly protein ShyY1
MSAGNLAKPVSLLSPRMLGIHLLAVALVAAMVVVGLWQLGRYDEQQFQALRAAATAAANAPPVALDTVLRPDAAFPAAEVGTKVSTTGRYAPAGQQFYVRGRPLNGRSGYWLLAPLRIRDSAILVVRGWLAQPPERPPDAPAGTVTVTGWLQPPEAAPTAAGAAPRADRVIRSISTAALVSQLPYDLYSGYVVLAAQRPPSSGLEVVPQPVEQAAGAAGWRNLAYASQWWIFGAFVLFMWWRIVRDARVA